MRETIESVEQAIKICDHGFLASICGIVALILACLGFFYHKLITFLQTPTLIAFLLFTYVLLELADFLGNNKIGIAGVTLITNFFLYLINIDALWIFLMFSSPFGVSDIFSAIVAKLFTLLLILQISLGLALLILLPYTFLELSRRFKVETFKYTAITLMLFNLFLLAYEFLRESLIGVLAIALAVVFFLLLLFSFKSAKSKFETILKNLYNKRLAGYV